MTLRINGFMCLLLCLFLIGSAFINVGREPWWKIILVLTIFGTSIVWIFRLWQWSWKKD